MCLNRLSGTKALITDGDKIVFKKVVGLGRGKYSSEFQQFRYEDGYHYTNDNFPMDTLKREFNEEGLHSFSCRKDSHGYLFAVKNGEYSPDKNGEYCLIECIIPYNTPYYLGWDGDIISRELIVIGAITRERGGELIEMSR